MTFNPAVMEDYVQYLKDKPEQMYSPELMEKFIEMLPFCVIEGKRIDKKVLIKPSDNICLLIVWKCHVHKKLNITSINIFRFSSPFFKIIDINFYFQPTKIHHTTMSQKAIASLPNILDNAPSNICTWNTKLFIENIQGNLICSNRCLNISNFAIFVYFIRLQ